MGALLDLVDHTMFTRRPTRVELEPRRFSDWPLELIARDLAMLAELDNLLPRWCARFQQDLNAAMRFRRRASLNNCYLWLDEIRGELDTTK